MKVALASEAASDPRRELGLRILMRGAWRALRRGRRPDRRAAAREPLTAAAVLVLIVLLLCAVAPQWVAHRLPTEMDSDAILVPPGSRWFFGTDQFGRDVFSLVVYGARQSVVTGSVSVLLGAAGGASLGVVAGYAGGWADMLLMRVVDVWMSIPPILLAIALATALGASQSSTVLAISVLAVPRFARVMRGEALVVRGQAFVEAARLSGASHAAILRRHVLPHCFSPLLVLATLGVASAVTTSAALSFLGLGVNDERPDWGYLLAQGRGYLSVAWWTVTYPGLAVTALVVSVNLLGDALRRRAERREGRR